MELLIAAAVIMTAVSAILAGLATLWTKVIKPVIRGVKRGAVLADSLSSLPDWCESVNTTLLELQPNSGGSIKDQIAGLTVSMGDLTSMVELHISDSTLHNTIVEDSIEENSTL